MDVFGKPNKEMRLEEQGNRLHLE